MQEWPTERERQRGNAWQPIREILNDAGARMPEHRCRIPIRARIAWADGPEEWIDTTALGWAGDLVYVYMWGTGHGVNAAWLHASDVARR
jgi:hypothetical protein